MARPDIVLSPTQQEQFNHAENLRRAGNGPELYSYLHGIENAGDRNQVLRKFKEIDQKKFDPEGEGSTKDASLKLGVPHLEMTDDGTNVTSLKAVKSATTILATAVEEVIY